MDIGIVQLRHLSKFPKHFRLFRMSPGQVYIWNPNTKYWTLVAPWRLVNTTRSAVTFYWSGIRKYTRVYISGYVYTKGITRNPRVRLCIAMMALSYKGLSVSGNIQTNLHILIFSFCCVHYFIMILLINELILAKQVKITLNNTVNMKLIHHVMSPSPWIVSWHVTVYLNFYKWLNVRKCECILLFFSPFSKSIM